MIAHLSRLENIEGDTDTHTDTDTDSNPSKAKSARIQRSKLIGSN